MTHGAKAWLSDVDSPNYVAARRAVEKVRAQLPRYR